ncbi:phosphomevalonate kinase [Sporosarcina sp. HYO08]|uniref:phosphomevalonate kinase n=1 Tax=Sporosarcina sp. HYO08 TaxID=1759557 RepID=UPI000798F967|nr:phosphomevalonate kinase [Sporosarcina sp. HYO08]KXH81736.1 hypothetical protein AU377_05585 [Sporosarcina sp. HYO08]
MTSSIHVRVPGKLMIAGEYAVLEPGGQAIVAAVDRYMQAVIKSDESYMLSLPQLGLENVTWTMTDGKITFNSASPKLAFLKSAIQLFHHYLKEIDVQPRPFSLTITSELDDASGKKYGLGSSAAVVVTIIKSLSEFYSVALPILDIYKLAAIAHFKTQGNGSCADVAASAYGGWLQYAPFQAEWLLQELNNETSIVQILRSEWPNLFIESITPPSQLKLCVGWTQSVARTAPMVAKIQQLRHDQPELFQQFLENSKLAVQQVVRGFKEDDPDLAIKGLAGNRVALMQLSDAAVVSIETPTLKTLIQIADRFGSGKTSGAGGGDCGIAFVKGEAQAEALEKEWRKERIDPLNLKVSQIGAERRMQTDD